MEIHLPHLRGQIRQKAAEKGEKCGMFILYLDRKPTIPANDLLKWWSRIKEYSSKK
jgi:hypothetical protein